MQARVRLFNSAGLPTNKALEEKSSSLKKDLQLARSLSAGQVQNGLRGKAYSTGELEAFFVKYAATLKLDSLSLLAFQRILETLAHIEADLQKLGKNSSAKIAELTKLCEADDDYHNLLRHKRYCAQYVTEIEKYKQIEKNESGLHQRGAILRKMALVLQLKEKIRNLEKSWGNMPNLLALEKLRQAEMQACVKLEIAFNKQIKELYYWVQLNESIDGSLQSRLPAFIKQLEARHSASLAAFTETPSTHVKLALPSCLR